ncbi:hypothetical protein AAVH_15324 [Aphelenchoides avenae]|nr:hypothetical protein AAVH_15324 [Aphelenchus avenae]
MASAQSFFDLSQGPDSSHQDETSSEDSDFDEQPQVKRKGGPALRYKLHKYFRMVGEYKNWWKAENEKTKWIVKTQLFGWFEGLVPYVVNNNGLESLNASIKRDHTLRRTLPLPAFLESVEKMLGYWSTNLKVASEDAYIVTSSVAKHPTPVALFASYQRSFVSEPANWDEYCNRRYEVFKVARSVLCGGSYYT